MEKAKVQEPDSSPYDYIVTPYPERFSNLIPLPYPIVYILFSICLFGVYSLTCFLSNYPIMTHAKLVAIFSLLTGSLAIAIIWFSKSLENFTPSLLLFIDWSQEQTVEWYESKLRSIFRLKWMFISGVVLAAVILPSILYCEDLWENFSGKPKIISLSILTLVCFLGGGTLYSMAAIAKMVHELGKLQAIKVSIYQHPTTSVKAVGSLLSRISLYMIAIYLLAISVIYFEPALCKKHMIGLAILFGVIVVSFFIFPQYKIHEIMAKVKHIKLRKFSAYLEESLEAVTKEPSRRNVQKVRELFEIQHSLNGMGEWPFDTKLLLIIITSIAIPLIIAAIHVYSTLNK